MAIFQVTPKEFKPLLETSFGTEGLMERRDLQRLLREQISALDERLLVIAEEFGDWLDSSRRIDLLCLDSEANLVVVELKRTDDGGHMELQALRYAAMVSSMTFAQLVDTFARYKSKAQPDAEAARAAILEFLHWDSVDEDQFARDARIILAAADFSRELTTAVMWLIDHDIDVRCVRMKPYRMADGTILLDVQQLIPLPEATAFQTKIGVKKQAEREGRGDRQNILLKFWEGLLEQARAKTDLHANRKPTTDSWISGSIGRAGFSLNYSIRKDDSQVELWISLGSGQKEKNKEVFHALESQRTAIEGSFGGPLEWQELPEGEGSRIRFLVAGGYKSPQDEWPSIYTSLVDAMIRLDKVFRPRVASLKI